MKNDLFKRIEWKLYKKRKINRLKNKNFSVLSINCNGGVMLHDLEQPFLTPTINTGFMMKDFITFLRNTKYYLGLDIKPGICKHFPEKPAAELGDISLIFGHYKTYEDGYNSWMKRRDRVDYNNLFIVCTDQLECTYEDIKAFDELDYKHKVIFTHKPYPEIKSAYYIKGFEDKDEVGILSDFKPGFLKRRYFDVFDYVSFFNGVSVEELNKRRKDLK